MTTEAPAIRREPDTSVARAASQFGITVANIAKDFIKVKADQEYAKAKIESYKALAQVEAESAQDDDFQNFETKYAKKLQEVKDNTLKTIRSPQAKRAFQDDFELKSTYSYYDIMADGRKRFIAYDKDLMTQETVITKDRYFTATTPQEKQNAKDELAQVYSRRVENRILNKAEAGNLYKKDLAGLDEGQAEHDILANPVYAQAELQKGQQGIYKGIEQIKRIDLIKQAASRIEKIKNQQEEAMPIAVNKREADSIDLKISGTLTEKQVKADRDSGLITPKFADSMIKALRSPKTVGAKTKNAKFVGFVNDMLYNKVKPKDIEIALMEANTAGSISDEDFGILVTFNKEVNASQKLEQALPNVSFMKGVQFWGDENAGARDESKQRMFRNYMTKVKSGKDPEISSNETIKEEVLTLFPQAKTAPKEGIDIIDLNGTIKHITPDGELTIVNQKEKK